MNGERDKYVEIVVVGGSKTRGRARPSLYYNILQILVYTYTYVGFDASMFWIFGTRKIPLSTKKAGEIHL